MNAQLLVYLLAFGGAAAGSFVGVLPARDIRDPDTRRGLVWLLALSGAWAAAHVGFLAAPSTGLRLSFYDAGLVVGLAAVGAWLYFCSAYSGRSLHLNPTFRRIAVVVFLALVALKLTNPIHHLYYTTSVARTPFVHLDVHNGTLHWLVMGAAYALATVGYFMLLELFLQVSYNTRPLAALVGLTALPALLDVAGLLSPQLVNITYEPLGVAVFAVGVLLVYRDRFESIRLAGGNEEPVVVLDAGDRLRDFNRGAREIFPELRDGEPVGEPLETVLPTVAETVGRERAILERSVDGESRYYHVASNPFSADASRLGRILTFSDVTDRERYRRELERQNERLTDFASMVSHDLRNPLTVARGRLDVARDDADSEHLEAAAGALDRMESIIEDVLTLARTGQPPSQTESVRLGELVGDAWEMVETDEAEYRLAGDLTFEADPSRGQQLLENLFRNAVEHGRPDSAADAGPGAEGQDLVVTVGTIGNTGFYVADNGPGVPEEDRDGIFESGYTTAAEGTGFGLAIVREIAEAHGWDVSVTDSSTGGARFEIRGVQASR